MSTRDDYSADEWTAISAAPVAAGLVFVLSDVRGGIGGTPDTPVVPSAILQSTWSGAPEIVTVLIENVKRGAGHPELPELPRSDRAHAKEALIGTVRTAVRVIERKSPAEAELFKAWLASVAARVCHAGQPRGGGAHVSRDKQDTIDRLAVVLGVTRATRGTVQRNPRHTTPPADGAVSDSSRGVVIDVRTSRWPRAS